MKRMIVAVCAALVLAGCGGGASGGGSSSTFTTAKDLAAKVGCTDLVPHSGVMYEKDGAECKMPSGDASVVIFADDTARDSWVKVATSVGTTNVVQGSSWVVACPDTPTATKVAKETGGSTV